MVLYGRIEQDKLNLSNRDIAVVYQNNFHA